MSPRVPVFAALLLGGVQAEPAFAQAPPPKQQASVSDGHVRGLVRDDAGSAVGGVMIVALGTISSTAKSDQTGHFALVLPPGEYILRAARDGYVSTYREAVRIQSSTLVERVITLLRQGVAAPGNAAQPKSATDNTPQGHGHDEAAWRLRHLPATVLRDLGPDRNGLPANAAADFKPRTSFLDWALAESSRAAGFLTRTDFTGQVNFLTTSTMSASGGWLRRPERWSGGVASISVGAPVGSYGDWRIRGGMNRGDLPSWMFAGDYQAKDDRAHVFAVGVSYTAQTLAAIPAARVVASGGGRRVGGTYGSDRWQINPRIEIDYGVRFDRYDYLAQPELLSPRAGIRVKALGHTYISASAGRHTIAPGADEFLPPPASNAWLPPERTFSPLAGSAIHAERVDSYRITIAEEFGTGPNLTSMAVRRFRQEASDQIVTLFGLDSTSETAHYFVATPGDVTLDGWGVTMAGRLAPYVRGKLDYSVSEARWLRGRDVAALARVAPSTIRPQAERLHDVSATVEAKLPHASTLISASYRLNSAFSDTDVAEITAGADGRFDLLVHQPLPYQPFRGGRIEVVFALRTLARDLTETGSVYDELLTIAPPLRIMGGVRVKF
jgi:carboxypeptidase family protein/TonB-dependent receptor-like protein